jgi:CheY-like chemotaxis protein
MASPYTILLVDDDAEVREITAHVLRSRGFDVLAARNGDEAMRLLAKIRPDVLLADIVMPGLDGIGVGEASHAAPARSQGGVHDRLLLASRGSEEVGQATVQAREGSRDRNRTSQSARRSIVPTSRLCDGSTRAWEGRCREAPPIPISAPILSDDLTGPH